MQNRFIKKAIVIGAGPSGLFAARKLQRQGVKTIVLESADHVGGKCYTYSDPVNPMLKTEWGAALVAPNYGEVIDAIVENQINWEKVLPADTSKLTQTQQLHQMTWLGKLKYGTAFLMEMMRFNRYVEEYNRCKDAQSDLPEDFKLPFEVFAKKHSLEKINEFAKLFVPAFGYGAMSVCPAHAVFEYFGKTTILSIVASPFFMHREGFNSIQNGYQSLMEKVAEPLRVKLNVRIDQINRDENGVTVKYKGDDRMHHHLNADALVIATSPYQWQSFGMALTSVEKQCIDDLTYYRYPVAVVKLWGFPPKHYFTEEGTKLSGVGKLALITTRDNRDDPEDGRLCTAYINQPMNDDHFEFTNETIKRLKDDLLDVPGVSKVRLVSTKIWEDYMPSLPWKTRLALEKAQMSPKTNTLYVGAYPLGGFEDVACVVSQSTKAVDRYILQNDPANDESYYKDYQRARLFYLHPIVPPMNDEIFNQSKANKKS